VTADRSAALPRAARVLGILESETRALLSRAHDTIDHGSSRYHAYPPSK
jgi:hypothetical protein